MVDFTGYINADGLHVKDGLKNPLAYTFKESDKFLEFRRVALKPEESHVPARERRSYEVVDVFKKDKLGLVDIPDDFQMSRSGEQGFQLYCKNPRPPVKWYQNLFNKIKDLVGFCNV